MLDDDLTSGSTAEPTPSADGSAEPRATTRRRSSRTASPATPVAETPAADAEAKPAKKAVAKKRPRTKAAADDAPAEPAARTEDGAGEDRPAPKKRSNSKKKPAAAGDEPSDPEEQAVPADTDGPATKKSSAKKGAKKKASGKAGSGKGSTASGGADTGDQAAAADAVPLFQAPETVVVPAAKTDDGAQQAPDGEHGEDEQGGDEQPGRRRRRRGGRRRRKPSDSSESETGTEGAEDATGGTAEGDGDGTENGGKDGTENGGKDGTKDRNKDRNKDGEQSEGSPSSSSSRRRRRRRRAGEEGGGSGDDPENTVTRVRSGRSSDDQITALSGSTRLEAKKQRRREGREAGRRRAPIVSEAEFLARRESVDRTMVLRQHEDLTQIAVLEDKVLVEHYVARESQTSLIGNVYLGRVQNVLPSMEAAFIDIGKGRNAVLYAGEVNWSALGHQEGQPRKIESVLSSGQSVLVQVTKDPVGHKGARLTSQISLPGRFLVYVPDGTNSGISRKLPDTERNRLKSLLKEIVPEGAGVIVRTAAEGASEKELVRDVERLTARWSDIEKQAKGSAPQLLYGEPDLTLKVVRDLFTEDFSSLVVQGDDAWETVHAYVEHVAPDLEDRLQRYDPGPDGQGGKADVFAEHRITEQIRKGLDRKVWLPSGGSLIIDRTEAMTVVDVNTGKFTGSGGNLEETVTKNNLEAAEEIVRQLRLRDIGGIIVVDFIDMVLESNRDLVLRRLVECLGRDRTRHQVAEVTSLGLVQMTRKRIGTGLLEAFSTECEHCKGRGVLVSDMPVEQARSDDEGRRGRRRGRGRGGDQNGSSKDTSGAKPASATPSPKDIAAMARPDAKAAEGEEAAEATDDSGRSADDGLADAPDAGPVESQTAPDGSTAEAVDVGQQAEQTEHVEESGPHAQPEPSTDAEPSAHTEPSEAPEPSADAPGPESGAEEPPSTGVVKRTRRRAASRPGGPPSSGVAGTQPANGAVEPGTADVEPGPETGVGHVPVKRRGRKH